jgi:radical SAM protein with 4Fe4S-binding SPASM domain
MPSRNSFLALAEGVSLKRLEFPAVYDARTDELYEVDPGGFEELSRCDGTLAVAESAFPRTFLAFCLDEGLLLELAEPENRPVPVGINESPSLRYLMLEVTDRCNLACRHCYLGDAVGLELSIDTVKTVLDEFDGMGGLRLIVTGGEPLLHPGFEAINEAIAGRSCRTILITNGTMLSEELCRGLAFNEVQVSLDGMQKGHDSIRGTGSFERAREGIECLRLADVPVSIATMVHSGNTAELDALEALVMDLEAVSWTLDVPCEAGRMEGGAGSILPPLDGAAAELGRAFGSEQHSPSGEYACGAHLACVKADGLLAKCGFYEDWNGGPVGQGLRRAWLALPRLRLEELDCRCEALYECGGGCRFRAEATGGRTAPDPLKCAQYGVESPTGI